HRAHIRGVQEIEYRTRHAIRGMIHDGPQHRLVAAQILLATLRAASEADRPAVLDALAEQLQSAVRDLRDITEGIFPAMLRETGLGEALNDLAQHSPTPLILNVEQRRWGEHVERTLYFLVAEAVGNAVKHAQATLITVKI